jgi:repressor LexA
MKFSDRLSRILSGKKSLEKISQAEIARRLGVHPTSISDWKSGKSEPSIDMMHKLAESLDVSPGELLGEKAPQLVDMSKWVTLPVIGKVPAGVALEAIEEYEGEIIVPPEDARPGYFALKVQGESMHPRVLSGDVVVVAPNLEPYNGQVVVTRVNGEGEVTLKEFQRDGETILLVPENKAFQTKVFRPGSELKIVGVVVSLQRRRV